MAEEAMKVKLTRGTLCKVINDNNQFVKTGDIVEFLTNTSSGAYTVKLADGSRATLNNVEDFTVLPLVSSLKHVIDLALSTKDKAWFDDLMFQLETESVTE